MNKRLLLLAAVLLCLSLPILKAQKWSCAAQIGTTAYSGDVGEHLNWQPNINRTAFGASLAYNATDFLTVRLNVLTGQLSSSDLENTTTPWRKQRAFSFKTPFVESTILTEWNVYQAIAGEQYTDPPAFSVHLLFGIGVNRIDPTINFNEPNPISEKVSLDKNAPFNRNQIVIPYGVIAKWRINETSAIRLEVSMRKTFSDYFDGVSQAASAKNKDAYTVASIGWEQTLSWGLTGWERIRFSSGNAAYCPKF